LKLLRATFRASVAEVESAPTFAKSRATVSPCVHYLQHCVQLLDAILRAMMHRLSAPFFQINQGHNFIFFFYFQKAYRSWKDKINELGFYSGFAFDAVIAMALALNKSAEVLASRNKSLDEFTYKDKEMAQIFKGALSSVKFLGFSVKT